MRKINLSESKEDIIKILLNEDEEEYVKISPEKYIELLKFSGYHGKGISKLPMFKNKPIWITGDLDVHGTPVDSLGNVKYIDGKLDIRDTNISDLSGVVVKSYTWDNGTPIEKRRNAAILKEKMDDANSRREDEEWSLENADYEGLCAIALFNNLVNDGQIEELDDDEREELSRLKSELEVAEDRYNELDDHDEDLSNEISVMEQRIEELENMNNDVYRISPQKYNYYGLQQFEVIGIDGLIGNEYAVGDEEDVEKAAKEYAENYIDEVGIDGFNKHFLEQHLDTDAIEDYFRDFYEDDIRDNPESYFDPSDFDLSDAQERRIETLEEYIEKLNSIKSKLEKQQNDLEDQIEDPDEYSKKYDVLQSKIDTCDSQIEDAQDEIDNMEPDSGNISQVLIDREVESQVEDKLYDPLSSLKEWGMDYTEYIDKDSLAEGLVETDGYGILSSYDGQYDSIEVNGKYFYILRLN